MPLSGDYEPGTSARSRTQVELFEATNGKQGGDLRGRPVVVLTSVGARTGKLRKTALMRVEHDGAYAVVASLGGAPRHPVWYHNLKANPHVELQDGAVRRDYLAREVTGTEKATWWARAIATWPDYAAYQARTDREIPVFVLEAIDERRSDADGSGCTRSASTSHTAGNRNSAPPQAASSTPASRASAASDSSTSSLPTDVETIPMTRRIPSSR